MDPSLSAKIETLGRLPTLERENADLRRRLAYLEYLVVELARRLDVELPNEPTIYLGDPLRGLRR